MKTKISHVLFFFFLLNGLYAQNDGDFRSQTTGNWSNITTWERYNAGSSIWEAAGVGNNNPGQIPSNTNAVTIQAHTVTIDANADCNDLTISGTGTLQGTANTLSVYGNLTNSGTLDLWNTSGTALIFAGTGSATFSGAGATTDVYTVEINKDVLASTVQLSTTNFSVQGTTASAPKFLTLTTGTFRLSGSFTMSSQVFVGGTAYNFNNDEGFWLDNSNFTIQGQDGQMQFNGICHISAGIFNVGDTSPQRFYMNNSSQFTMDGGTLNIKGAFYSGDNDPITYNQSGGTINVGLLTVTNGGWRCFRIDNANADLTISGGTINIVQTNSVEREYQVDSDVAHTHITGGTLNIGTSATAGDFDFEIQGRMPNVVVDNTTNVKTAVVRGTCYVYDDLTVNGIFRYRDAGNNVYVYGNLTVNSGGTFQVYQSVTANRTQRLYIEGSIVVNGDLDGFHLTGSFEARLYVVFQGTANASVTGTGSTCEFFDIDVNKSSGMATVVGMNRVFTMPTPTAGANRLSATSGTLKFSQTAAAITISPYWNNQNITGTAGKFWMDNSNLTISWANAGQATSNGEFVLDAGSFTAGTSFVIQGSSTAGNQINGGTLTCSAGGFDMEQDVLMTGGTIDVTGGDFIVDSNGADEYGDLTMQNGTININTGMMYISGNFEIDNGTLNVGDGDDNLRVYNDNTGTGTIQIDGGTVTVNGNFQIIDDATANNQINGGNITVTGNWDMEQDLTISDGSVTVSGNFYMDGNDNNETGDLTISGGTINIGDGDDLFQATGNGGDNGQGGSLTMSGGTLTVYGRVEFQNGTGTEVTSFTMSAGNFNVDPNDVNMLAANEDVVLFHDNAIVNFTGGTLTIVDPHPQKNALTRDALDIRGQTGAKNFVGSTIQFGDGVSASNGTAAFPGFSIYIAGGDLQLGDIILSNPAGSNREFYGRDNTNILCNNLTITTANDKYIINGMNLEVSGDFINNGELDGTVRNTNNHLLFTGSAAQTYSGSGSLTSTLNRLTFNNTSATGVTLNTDIGATTVTLTDGHVYTHASGSGLLTVYGTTPTSLLGGASTNHVKPYLRRAVPSSASNSEYDFPIGSTGNFRMLELQSLSTAGSGSGFITTFVSEPQAPAIAGTAGTGMANPLVLKDIYWKMTTDLSSVTISASPKVRLTYDASGVPPNCITQSNNAINGTYNSIGRLLGAGTVTSETFDLTGNGGLVPSGNAFLAIGQIQPIIGTLTVGASGDLLNLTEVADTLRKNYVLDDVYFEMLDDYDDDTETIPVEFNTLMLVEADDYVVIHPSASGTKNIETIQAGTAGGMITFDNIHALTIDGRRSSAETTIAWTFANINGTPGATFEFKNDAHHNNIKYLNIESDLTATNSGVVKFGTTNQTNGNDNNTIEYCNITGRSSNPTIAVYSAGTAGKTNSSNTVSNCKIYDFFNATEDPRGIWLADNNDSWTISSNSLYQTATRTFTEDQIYCGIQLSSGTNHSVDGNVIGYGAANRTGTTTVDAHTNTTLSRFCGIWLNTANGTATTVENNEIAGISFTTDYAAGDNCGVFSGIYVEDGDVDIGSLGNGNRIGSLGTTGSITIQHESEGYSYAFKTDGDGDEVNFIGNSFGGMTVTGLAANDRIYIRGIYVNNGINYTITNNTIGGTVANSVQAGQSGVTTGRTDIYGIYNRENTTVNISNNEIANLTVYGENNNSRLNGIYCSHGNNTINNNEIHSLISYSTQQLVLNNPCIVGIRRTSALTNQQIVGNEIYGLKNNRDDGGGTNDARNSNIVGITYNSCETEAGNISRNFIHNFSAHSSNEDAIFTGIHIDGVEKNDFPDIIANNMIQFGFDETGASINQPLRMYGIYYDIDAPINFYHNSIYIGGTTTDPEGADSIDSTFCIYKDETSLSVMKNNIFVNDRSNSLAASNGRHYSIDLSYNEVVVTDYNIYKVNTTANSGGKLARLDGNELLDLRSIQSYANNGNDLHSGFGDPNFATPNGTSATCDLHLTGITPAEGMGEAIASVTTDYDGQTRSSFTPNDIGADAGNYTFNTDVDIYTPYFEYTPIEAQACATNSVTIDVTITDQGSGIPKADSGNNYIPRVYYRDNSGGWALCSKGTGTFNGQSVTNNVYTSKWTFTLNGLTDAKMYEYYFVAQDSSTYPSGTLNPQIGYSKFDNNSPVHTDTDSPTTYPDDDVNIDAFSVCVSPNATYTVGNAAGCSTVLGTTCDFETLTATQDFFFQMNAMTINKNVICYIVADTDEPATVAAEQFTEDGSGPYTISIRSYDATAKTLTCTTAPDANMIRFEGGDRYSIDGQYYNAGVPDANSWLTFLHEDEDQSVFLFKNDAQNDTLKYLTIKASNILMPFGVIFVDSTTLANPSGNSDLVIEHNTITKYSSPPSFNIIYSYGGGGASNSCISITNNVISEFQNVAVWATTHSNDSWTISDNTIFNSFVDSELEAAISINSGDGYTIDNNYIGGSDINLGGSAMENDYRDEFNAIYITGDTDVISNISNNTIKNITCSLTEWGNNMRGIRVDDGWANINGNTISAIENNRNNYTLPISYTGKGGISVSNNQVSNITGKGNGNMRIIYIDSSSNQTAGNTIHNNVIKNITLDNTGGNNHFIGIYSIQGNASIVGNTLGGYNASDKITHKGGDFFYGIRVYGDDMSQDFNDNKILNVEVTANDDFRGFYINDTDDGVAFDVENNLIDNISLNSSTSASLFYITDGLMDLKNNRIGTTTGVSNTGNAHLYGIWFSTNDNNSVLQDNTLSNMSATSGATAIHCDENRPFVFKNNRIGDFTFPDNAAFTGIRTTAGNTISLQGNIIEGITMSNAGASTDFNGIWVSGGTATIGTTTANTIGTAAKPITNAGTGVTNGIQLSGGSGTQVQKNNISYITGKGDVNCILSSANSATISDHTFTGWTLPDDMAFSAVKVTGGSDFSIQNIKVENISMSNTGVNTSFTGINISDGSGNVGTSTGNTIGHTTAANSISVAGVSLTGIACSSASAVTIQNNLIANLSSTSVSASGSITGLSVAGSGTKTVSANIIRDLTTSSTRTDVSSGVLASQGMHLGGSSTSQIYSNTIYNIAASGTASSDVAAISVSGTAVRVFKNKIYGISNTASGADRTANGFSLYQLNSGYVANNYISIGENDATNYCGIWIPNSDAATKNIYYNSIYIGGTATGGNSYGFLRENNTTPLYVRNNIFGNFRTGGAGKHYGIATRNTGWANSYVNSNDYYSATASTIGLWGATDTDFETWIGHTNEDADYLSTDAEPMYADGANCDLHLNTASSCAFNSVGEVIASVSDDYDGDARATHPDIGADEFTPTGASSNPFIWRGWTDTDWDTASNWQCEKTPSNTDDVIVMKSSNDATIDQAIRADEMEVKPNGAVIVSANNSLVLTGNLTLDGSLTVETDASFIDNGTMSMGGGGSAVVQRNLVGNGRYHYIASPVVSANTTVISSAYKTFEFTESAADNEPIDNAGWSEIGGSSFTAGKGYAAFWMTASPTVNFSGGLFRTGNQNIAITDMSLANSADFHGFNCVGNPYPSSISCNSFVAANTDITGTLYFWDDDNSYGSDFQTNDYASWNSLGSTTASAGGKSPNDYIPHSQGFFVRATSNATLTFTNAMRVVNTGVFFKDDYNIQRLKLSVTTPSDDYNELLIGFKDDATEGYDRLYDGVKMQGNPRLSFYSRYQNEDYAILGLPTIQPEDERVVDLGIYVNEVGEYVFEAKKIENFYAGTYVYLEDLAGDRIYDLQANQKVRLMLDKGITDGRLRVRFTQKKADLEQLREEQIKAYSFGKTIYVRIEAEELPVGDIAIYNVLGAEISRIKITKTTHEIPANYRAGTYIVRVITADKVYTNKVFVR